MRRFVATLALVACAGAPGLQAQGRPVCPAPTDSIVTAGWAAYRADSIARAIERFDAALARCPGENDATVGRAFAYLRTGSLLVADSIFRALIVRVPSSSDAWEGFATVSDRLGDRASAIAGWRRVVALAPDHAVARQQLDRLTRTSAPVERVSAPVQRRRAATLDLTMRVRGEGFELRRDGRWEPFFVKGVNLGVAMPGKFPAEFPTDSATYARWLGLIADMHANTLRLYTILPPEFYRALRAHNLAHADLPLYVMHGVWTELPPRNDFSDAAFNAGFADEIRRVVDVLHGAADHASRPGHAGGRYDADVSPWTIGYILGREWEPYSVEGYNNDPKAPRAHRGKHLTLAAGTATDAWMVRQCDLLLTYEDETYNAQRPIAYSNWPTTDPLKHPTETSYAQQMAFRGLKYERSPSDPPVHEEETVELDPSLVRTTPRNAAGWFASYHVYPYYPDFMLQDPRYEAARSTFGRSNYFGYLTALRSHHRGIPLLISEFGVPSSRGSAHAQPQGWTHGGLSETEAATITARMAAEIREAGAAGAIVFAWMDEWFKRNWFVADLEQPAERGRLWHNMQNPEEHYGLLALRPGAEGRSPLPGGAIEAWRALPVLQAAPLLGADTVTMRVGQDEGFVYIALEAARWRGRPFAWDSARLQLAIDTFDPDLGQAILPMSGLASGAGFEFLVELSGPNDAVLKVLPEYSPLLPAHLSSAGAHYGDPFRRPVLSVRRMDGVFDTLFALTNRPRFIGPGRQLRGEGHNPGRLRFGRAAAHSLADWWYDEAAGMLQLRLPWGLLNVGDPSARRVLSESDPEQALGRRPGAAPSQRTSVVTDGFRFAVVALRPTQDLLGTIPALDEYGRWPLERFRTWTWPTWETPTWHEYLKPVYHSLQELWSVR